MKRALQLVLLVGALIGLFGLEGAYASAPRTPAAAAEAAMTAMPMDADCMAMMTKQAQKPLPMPGPCKGMTLDCIAAMGCIVPMLTGVTGPMLAAPRASYKLRYWTVPHILVGDDRAPDLHPPSMLG